MARDRNYFCVLVGFRLYNHFVLVLLPLLTLIWLAERYDR